MPRKRNASPSARRVIKLTLDPTRDADLLHLIDGAPNKAQLVKQALRGAPAARKHAPVKPKVRDQLVAFLS